MLLEISDERRRRRRTTTTTTATTKCYRSNAIDCRMCVGGYVRKHVLSCFDWMKISQLKSVDLRARKQQYRFVLACISPKVISKRKPFVRDSNANTSPAF